MTQTEMNACVIYYRALAAKMGVSDILETYDAFDAFNRDYEAENFRHTATNVELGSLAADLLLSMYIPNGSNTLVALLLMGLLILAYFMYCLG